MCRTIISLALSFMYIICGLEQRPQRSEIIRTMDRKELILQSNVKMHCFCISSVIP